MPTLVPAELSAWLEERHANLHDAFHSCSRIEHHAVGRSRAHEMTGWMLS